MTPRVRPAWASIALGLFIVGQLLFLLGSNGLAVLDRVWPGHLVAALRTPPRRWAEMTEQPQNWTLFAPDVDTESVFVAVQLDGSTDRPPVPLLSANEPEDLRRYFRVGRFRLRRYEANLGLALTVPEGKEREDVLISWQARIKDTVREEAGPIRAYLRWKMRAFQGAHPQLPPPRAARLLMRLYRTPPPGEPLAEQLEQYPLARWRPDWDDPRWLPVEAFNPISGDFDPVRP